MKNFLKGFVWVLLVLFCIVVVVTSMIWSAMFITEYANQYTDIDNKLIVLIVLSVEIAILGGAFYAYEERN